MRHLDEGPKLGYPLFTLREASRATYGRLSIERGLKKEDAMRHMRRFRPSPALLIALLAIVIVSAGSAAAARLITSQQIKNGTLKKADLSKKLKNKIFDSTAFAKVDENGTLLSGRWATSVSRTSAGDFQVSFKKPVDGCAALATPRGTTSNEFYGFATTYTPPGKTVRVVLRNPNGAAKADGAGFNLGLIC
jgi:hypothetical protein